MLKADINFIELERARAYNSTIDKWVIVPILVFAYAVIISPLLIHFYAGPIGGNLQATMAPRPENRVFWPAVATICIFLALRYRSRLGQLTWPPHIICLLAYLALAGASVLWAFRPELSFSRFVIQVIIITSIVMPAMLAGRTADIMRRLFLCYAFATMLNVLFVLNQTPIYIAGESIGFPGYYTFKGTLGEFAAVAFLLSLHEMLYSGFRRASGIIVIAIATWLMIVSQSKGSLAFALIAPLLAGFTLVAAKAIRRSPAIVLLSMVFCYAAFSTVTGFNTNKLSWHIYRNYTLSNRTVIWDFADYEIARKPLLGWGYQSFWLVGPDGPSVVDAPGWVKLMPSAHNGYLDTRLETGYVGYAILLAFIIMTLHGIGRVVDRRRAWLLLTIALFVIMTNFLETTWMRGAEPLWMLFLVVAAEVGRCWQPSPWAVAQRQPGNRVGSMTPGMGSIEVL